MGEAIVRCENLSKNFGYRPVIRDITLQADDGEVFAIRGPNGSGKSTLLKIIAGLLRPTSGDTWVESGGRRLSDFERRMSMALAAPAIEPYAQLTFAENVKFFAEARGIYLKADEVNALAELVGLDHRKDDPVGSFSSGMVQRTRLAVAISARPRALFLDEPTECLDTDGQEIVKRIVQDQRSRGVTVIATNQDRDADLADRVFTLSDSQR